MKLSSGSVDNLKPELVMESFCKACGIPYMESALQFHRMELYCEQCHAQNGEIGDIAGESKPCRKFVPFNRMHMAGEFEDGI